MDHAGKTALPLHAAQQDPPGRHAAHERAGAVDGVDDPTQPGGASASALFLSVDAVLGVTRRNLLTHLALDLAIRRGHRVEGAARRLVVHRERRAEVVERDGPRGLRDGDRRLEALIELFRVHAGSLPRPRYPSPPVPSPRDERSPP